MPVTRAQRARADKDSGDAFLHRDQTPRAARATQRRSAPPASTMTAAASAISACEATDTSGSATGGSMSRRVTTVRRATISVPLKPTAKPAPSRRRSPSIAKPPKKRFGLLRSLLPPLLGIFTGILLFFSITLGLIHLEHRRAPPPPLFGDIHRPLIDLANAVTAVPPSLRNETFTFQRAIWNATQYLDELCTTPRAWHRRWAGLVNEDGLFKYDMWADPIAEDGEFARAMRNYMAPGLGRLEDVDARERMDRLADLCMDLKQSTEALGHVASRELQHGAPLRLAWILRDLRYDLEDLEARQGKEWEWDAMRLYLQHLSQTETVSEAYLTHEIHEFLDAATEEKFKRHTRKNKSAYKTSSTAYHLSWSLKVGAVLDLAVQRMNVSQQLRDLNSHAQIITEKLERACCTNHRAKSKVLCCRDVQRAQKTGTSWTTGLDAAAVDFAQYARGVAKALDTADHLRRLVYGVHTRYAFAHPHWVLHTPEDLTRPPTSRPADTLNLTIKRGTTRGPQEVDDRDAWRKLWCWNWRIAQAKPLLVYPVCATDTIHALRAPFSYPDGTNKDVLDNPWPSVTTLGRAQRSALQVDESLRQCQSDTVTRPFSEADLHSIARYGLSPWIVHRSSNTNSHTRRPRWLQALASAPTNLVPLLNLVPRCLLPRAEVKLPPLDVQIRELELAEETLRKWEAATWPRTSTIDNDAWHEYVWDRLSRRYWEEYA
ncbi:uncharacterized protein F5Z01DRAFT_343251 [Emericellopsis atlantica]|uniref:Uncharacterized protein n=1 Tax=Emericellopsis atlantica TaxID=2614577 RepID=A0A9P7ZFF7_9HYPO|nr:uncharacterized protein F5Z01DRAFT_343251 [Emericellopsis atlantica]KAG9250837.1 hypothetical protein F5Z01DRAFT_343251 [Emericellopsis atlantica]